MSDPAATTPFAQPLAELALRSQDGDATHTFTLRLTDDALLLVPGPQGAADLAPALAETDAGLEDAPRIVRWLVGKMLGAGAEVRSALTPHPLAATAVTLAGPYLHVRLGAFDAEYGPGDFDPSSAAAFVQQYELARRRITND